MNRTLLTFLALLACNQGSIGEGGDSDDTLDPQDCPVQLDCQERVTAECQGVDTAVSLDSPGLCTGQDLSDDAPGTYPVGETVVTFTSSFAGEQDTCTTTVEIIDEEPPDVACPESFVVVQERPGLPVPAPDVAEAGDLCAVDLTIEAAPSVLTEPLTPVVYTATDPSGNSATCTTNVQILELTPATGLRVLSAVLGDSGQTSLVLGWEPSEGRDVTGYRIERSSASDGPWEEVGEASVDEQLFTVSSVPERGAWYRVRPVSGSHEGAATPPVRAYAIAPDVYHERGVRISSIPFDTDLYGIVRAPSHLDGGPYPLVLLLHGNHGNCRLIGTTSDGCATLTGHECLGFSGYETAPNADGMLFQAETLAAQGMIAVTLSANALNCRGGSGAWIPQRVEYLLENLRRWKSWNEGEEGELGTTYAGAVDLSRVGLIGHSRGGDAVANLPARFAETPIEGVEVKAIFSLAPTDFLTARDINAHYHTLLPSCDGDVSNLWGALIHDRTRDDGFDRSQYLFVGANHNFFNTEWTFNDGERVCPSSAVVSERPHTASLEAMLGSYMSAGLNGTGLEAYLRADAPVPTSIEAWAGEPLDLRFSYSAPGAMIIDRFESTPGVNLTGGSNTFDEFTVAFRCLGRGDLSAGRCGPRYLHSESNGMHIRWDAGEAALMSMELNELDTTEHGVLAFRVVSRWSTWNDGRSDMEFQIRVVDADGEEVSFFVSEIQPIPHLYTTSNIWEVLQSVRVPLSWLVERNSALDLERLDLLELDFSTEERRGSVVITDFELTD